MKYELAYAAGPGAGRFSNSRATARAPAERRFWEFFTAHIRNRNTRLAYLSAVRRFAGRCERRGLALDQVEPLLVAA